MKLNQETLTEIQLAQFLREHSTSNLIVKLEGWFEEILPVYHRFFLHITSKAMTSRSAPRSALTIIEDFDISVIKTEILALSICIDIEGNPELAQEIPFLCMMLIFNVLSPAKLFEMFMLFNAQNTGQFEEPGFSYEKLILDKPFVDAFLCKPIFVAAACARLPENNIVHQRKNMLRFLEKMVDLSVLNSIKSMVLNFKDSSTEKVTPKMPHKVQARKAIRLSKQSDLQIQDHPRILVRMQYDKALLSIQGILGFISYYTQKKLHTILKNWFYLIPELMQLLSHMVFKEKINGQQLPENIDPWTIREELLHALQELRVYTNDSSAAKEFPFLCLLYVFNATSSHQLYNLFKFIFSEEDNPLGNQQKHDILLNCRLSKAIFYNPLHIFALLARFPQTRITPHKQFALTGLKSVIQADILQEIEPLLMQICVASHNKEGATFTTRDEIKQNRRTMQKKKASSQPEELSITAFGIFRPVEAFPEFLLQPENLEDDPQLSLISCLTENF